MHHVDKLLTLHGEAGDDAGVRWDVGDDTVDFGGCSSCHSSHLARDRVSTTPLSMSRVVSSIPSDATER